MSSLPYATPRPTGWRIRHEGLPLLLICLDQTLLGTLQDKPQAVQIVQASAAAQANAETLRDKLPHHFPVPVGHFYARHLGQLLHCPRQLRPLRIAKRGGEPPVCSNIKAAEPALVKTGALPRRRRRPICRWCEHPGPAPGRCPRRSGPGTGATVRATFSLPGCRRRDGPPAQAEQRYDRDPEQGPLRTER